MRMSSGREITKIKWIILTEKFNQSINKRKEKLIRNLHVFDQIMSKNDLRVHFKGSIATLAGTVFLESDKFLAQDAVSKVKGVRMVLNYLEI